MVSAAPAILALPLARSTEILRLTAAAFNVLRPPAVPLMASSSFARPGFSATRFA
ncbi:hypothetical protein D9M68_889060 [compost metagenome]